jgi:hypothetical protein
MASPEVEKKVILKLVEEIMDTIDNRINAEINLIQHRCKLSQAETGQLYDKFLEHIIAELGVIIAYESNTGQE